LEQIDKACSEEKKKIIILSSSFGMGKLFIAYEIGHRLNERFFNQFVY